MEIVIGSGMAEVESKVADTELAVKPAPPGAIKARIPVIVPGILFWEVKVTTVAELPVAHEQVYEIPLTLNEMDTWFAAICSIVIPEFGPVHRLPIVFDAH